MNELWIKGHGLPEEGQTLVINSKGEVTIYEPGNVAFFGEGESVGNAVALPATDIAKEADDV